MTTKTIDEIVEAFACAVLVDPGIHSHAVVVAAIDELAALRAQVETLTAERDKLLATRGKVDDMLTCRDCGERFLLDVDGRRRYMDHRVSCIDKADAMRSRGKP